MIIELPADAKNKKVNSKLGMISREWTILLAFHSSTRKLLTGVSWETFQSGFMMRSARKTGWD